MRLRNLTPTLFVLLAVPALSRTVAPPPPIEEMLTSGIEDIQANVVVVQAEKAELEKINKDYLLAYRLKDVVMRYKEPHKLRMENKIGSMIFNGSSRFFRVPQLRISRRDDLGGSKGKRYSLLDVGLLTRASLEGVEIKPVRADKVDGVPVFVYDLAFKGDESMRYVLWIDPKTKVIVKREWFDGKGMLKAVFLYKELKEPKTNIWIPTRLEIRNAEGGIAAVTGYTEIKLNQGLDDSLFDTM